MSTTMRYPLARSAVARADSYSRRSARESNTGRVFRAVVALDDAPSAADGPSFRKVTLRRTFTTQLCCGVVESTSTARLSEYGCACCGFGDWVGCCAAAGSEMASAAEAE